MLRFDCIFQPLHGHKQLLDVTEAFLHLFAAATYKSFLFKKDAFLPVTSGVMFSYIWFVRWLTQKCYTRHLPMLNELKHGALVSLKFCRKHCANIWKAPQYFTTRNFLHCSLPWDRVSPGLHFNWKMVTRRAVFPAKSLTGKCIY